MSCSSCLRRNRSRICVGVQQAGDAEVVGLLVAARRGRRAERGAVEDHLIQLGVGAERLETVVLLGGFVLLRRVDPSSRRRRRPTRGAACRARGRAGPPSGWPGRAASAPTAGRCSPSRPAAATARTGRSPARRTAVSTRWWRRRRPPAAARRHPRTPSAPRPATGWCLPRTRRCAPTSRGRRTARRSASRR